ncbi:MAG: histidine phosphatase family protein [Anaerolinea sp.]|nr:histidine phosphatase family protein [Anaerolinea sp.]
MKQLTLVRHGKSEWETGDGIDFDRPLKERGRKDAPLLGKFLAGIGLVPDLVVSSPAVRARQTAELLAPAMGYSIELHWEASIYAASAGELMSVLRRLPDEAGHVLLIGHNPGFEDLAARLIGADAYGMAAGLRLPTGGMAHLALAVDSWNAAQANSGQLIWLVNPRMLKAVMGSG